MKLTPAGIEYNDQDKYWYSLTYMQKANLIEAIAYSISYSDDECIGVSIAADDELGDDEAESVGDALDRIAANIRRYYDK